MVDRYFGGWSKIKRPAGILACEAIATCPHDTYGSCTATSMFTDPAFSSRADALIFVEGPDVITVVTQGVKH